MLKRCQAVSAQTARGAAAPCRSFSAPLGCALARRQAREQREEPCFTFRAKRSGGLEADRRRPVPRVCAPRSTRSSVAGILATRQPQLCEGKPAPSCPTRVRNAVKLIPPRLGRRTHAHASYTRDCDLLFQQTRLRSRSLCDGALPPCYGGPASNWRSGPGEISAHIRSAWRIRLNAAEKRASVWQRSCSIRVYGDTSNESARERSQA